MLFEGAPAELMAEQVPEEAGVPQAAQGVRDPAGGSTHRGVGGLRRARGFVWSPLPW